MCHSAILSTPQVFTQWWHAQQAGTTARRRRQASTVFFPDLSHGSLCLTAALESEDEYSDDDDMSWKVRRAAAKCMAALISSRPDLLPDFHCTLAPALIRRFKEREENVKADIFGAYIILLRQTRPPKGWLEAVEEPTQTGSNLNMLRAQVGCVLAHSPSFCSSSPPASHHLLRDVA